MRKLLAAIKARILRPERNIHVILTYEDGSIKYVGPMDMFTAEVYLVHRMWPETRARRVIRARLVLP